MFVTTVKGKGHEFERKQKGSMGGQGFDGEKERKKIMCL